MRKLLLSVGRVKTKKNKEIRGGTKGGQKEGDHPTEAINILESQEKHQHKKRGRNKGSGLLGQTGWRNFQGG